MYSLTNKAGHKKTQPIGGEGGGVTHQKKVRQNFQKREKHLILSPKGVEGGGGGAGLGSRSRVFLAPLSRSRSRLKKKTRSRSQSRLLKKSGAGAAKKLAAPQPCEKIKRKLYFSYSSLGAGPGPGWSWVFLAPWSRSQILWDMSPEKSSVFLLTPSLIADKSLNTYRKKIFITVQTADLQPWKSLYFKVSYYFYKLF